MLLGIDMEHVFVLSLLLSWALTTTTSGSSLLLQSSFSQSVEDALSGLRQFLACESPLEI